MRRFLVVYAAIGVFITGSAVETAWAAPITGTEVSKFSESFSDEPTLCQDELYTSTATGVSVMHFTYFPDTGALHFHQYARAKVVAVPLDGTGPSYRGNFVSRDSENIRAVRHGSGLVEVDTDLNRFVARGSDGSRAFIKDHLHFTFNANGDVVAQILTSRLVCTQ